MSLSPNDGVDRAGALRRPLLLPDVRSPANASLSGALNRGRRRSSRDSSPSSASFDSSDGGYADVVFGAGVALTSAQLRRAFPFHIAVSLEFNILQMGVQLASFLRSHTILRSISYEHIGRFFTIHADRMRLDWDWEQIRAMKDGVFELRLVNDFLISNSQRSGSLQGGLVLATPAEEAETQMRAIWLLCPFETSTAALWDTWALKPTDLPAHFLHRHLLEQTEQRNLDADLVSRLEMRNAALLQEVEALQQQVRAQDARHLISNVAHDLKTPLAAFLSGLEMAQTLVEGLLPGASSDQYEDLTAALASLRTMRDVNNFMTMTINRCIDYTKASQGLKLVPKYETVDLQEALALPLHCISAMQSKVRVSLRPVDSSICSHIITDCQWLQENLLCLLSNAVKYSHHGETSVRIALIAALDDGVLSPRQQRVIRSQLQSQSRQSFGSLQAVRSRANSSSSSPTRSALLQGAAGSPSAHKATSPLAVAVTSRAGSGDDSSHNQNSDDLYSERTNSGPALLSPLSASLEMDMSAKTQRPTILDQLALKIDLDVATAQLLSPLLLVEVEDEGIGLSDEALETLFSPFQQAQRHAGGTGLGLFSLAKRLEALSGFYGVEHRRDGRQGSLFWFAFPYRPDLQFSRTAGRMTYPGCAKPRSTPLKRMSAVLESAAAFTPSGSPRAVGGEDAATPMTREPSRAALPSGRLRILLVDDALPVLKMTSMMLRKVGHDVETAENGAEALERLCSAAPGVAFDVVLMDLQMPIIDGLEATRRLRRWEQQRSRRVLVVGMSANGDEETVLDALDAGVDDFVCKPLTVQTLQSALERVLSAGEPSG